MPASYLAEAVGICAEVIDPIWLSPLDIDTIAESVERTGRLLVVDTGWADVRRLVGDPVRGVRADASSSTNASTLHSCRILGRVK